MKILQIQNLTVSFDTEKAVDDVSLVLNKGEVVGLVGESGCGKSLTALSVLKINPPNSKLSGKIIYKDIDLLSLDEKTIRDIRGNKISYIPQDPMSALNPVLTIGEQIKEVVEVHRGISRKDSFTESLNALKSVQIPAPEKRINDYPHQFSGGMKQRALIAMALITEPDIILADEPTTALDVTIQIQILEIMKQIRKKGKTILLITHDLAQIQEICDRVYVMYLGKIVEHGNVKDILTNPKHPYTIGLLNSLPDERKKTLTPISGSPPSMHSIPSGCAFHPRCPHVFEKCRKEIPQLYKIKDLPNHESRCFLEVGGV